jgi:hypothetical protein
MAIGTGVVTTLLTAPYHREPRVASVAVPVDDVTVGVLDATPFVTVAFFSFLLIVLAWVSGVSGVWWDMRQRGSGRRFVFGRTVHLRKGRGRRKRRTSVRRGVGKDDIEM